jgi:hypothetical protein
MAHHRRDHRQEPPEKRLMNLADRHHRLPIRLLPRRRAQIPQILGFGFFLGFAIFWMAGAAGVINLDEGTLHVPPSGGWAASSFALVGLPFAIIGLSGIVAACLKMLPGSPYYHLEVNAQGLVIRSPFKQVRYLWRALPTFETLEHRRRTKNGTRIRWYTVAVENASLEPGMEADAAHQREVLRIDADEYGAKNGQQDAADLAAWLNELRGLAIDDRLSPHESVEVPAGFVANAIVAPSPTGPANRAPTVVRR